MNDPLGLLIQMFVIVISIALHEFGHAAMADKLNDPTPRAQGRLTLNPAAHFDPLGFIMIMFTLLGGFGIGWGRPVQTNPSYYKHYRKGLIMVAIAGPAMNLCLASFAIASSYILYSSGVHVTVGSHKFLLAMLIINLSLIAFNLLPIPPLDGGNIAEQLVPWHWRRTFDKIKTYGPLLLILVVFSGLARPVFAGLFFVVMWLVSLGFGESFAQFLLTGSTFGRGVL